MNVAGYLRTESGVGAAARAYVRALRTLGLPLALTDLSFLSGNRAEDPCLSGFSCDNPYDITLVCADVEPQYAIVSHLGESLFQRSYCIGVWAWELPSFPQRWHDRFAYYDEVWVGTSYVGNALGPVAPIPVVRIPPPLGIPTRGSRPRGRARLGVGADELLFLFVFDVHSHVERKNPTAVVDAFRLAFRPSDPARLVLKCVNGNSNQGALADLRARAHGYPIRIIDEYWPAQGVADLMAACDCYVSLHRSEGIGLTIADAMTLGKPTIATGWSGNMDFMNGANSFPVRFELEKIERDVGPYRAGEVWAEPSVQDAAELMRLVYEDPGESASRAERARQDLETYYSESEIGRTIGLRLDAIRHHRQLRSYREQAWARFHDYRGLAQRIHQLIAQTLPSQATVAVVSKGDDALLPSDGRPAWHFPRAANGTYAGFYPADSAEAIRHLEAVRREGAAFLLIPSTGFWWLDYYDELYLHLERHYSLVLRDPATCVIYDLKGSAR
jgi:glycosyltransferase involved in cell wall biosynthesis